MRTALVLSTVLHVALFLIAVFGLPSVNDRMVMVPEAIPVEVVDVGAITNTRIEEQKERPKPAPSKPKPTPPKTQPPPPQAAKPEPAPPEPVKTPEPPKQVAEAPKPEPKTEPPEEKPAPKKEEPKPEPPKKVAEAPKPEPKKEEPKKPEPKKEEPKKEPPKKEPEKKQERSFDSVLKNLEKLKEDTPQPPQKEEPKPETETAQTAPSLDPSRSDRLTISEEDAVRRAVSQCWFVDAGARNVENQRVEVRVWMNPDRTVRDARIERSTADRATTDRALRAVLNPRCQPLPLPADQYDRWKVIVFNFDPKDMF